MNKEKLKELAATLNGIADGKAWETMAGPGASWESGEGCPLHCVVNGWKIRIKPEQQKVPLGTGDAPPGSVLRKSEWSSAWQSIFGAYDRGVSFNGALWEWNDIIDTHQINRSIPLTGKWNPEAWEPCYKLIDTP